MMIIEQMLNNAPKPLLHIADVSGSALFNADCMDILPLIPNKSVQLILADLPYGTTANKWDSVLDLNKLWGEYKRILSSNGTVLLFSSQPFTTDLIISARDWFKYEIIWDKMHGTDFQLANIKPMKAHENILVFAPNKTTYNKQMIKRDKAIDTIGWKQDKRNKDHNNFHSSENIVKVYEDKNPTTVLQYSMANGECNNSKRIHPTQKPIFIIDWLLKTYSNENDLVLDNTMGVGTTCLGAKELNRSFIGIEKEVKYYDLAVARVFG
jgi:site-specific DNA-methyltransferase (adenine-specific)